MSDKAINTALALHLQDLGLPVAFENAPFTPVDGQVYLREFHLPAETTPVGNAAETSDDHRGIYQVTVMAPADAYKDIGLTAAEQVKAHFVRGRTLIRDGVSIRVERVYSSPAIPSGSRWAIPVSIRYRAFVK